MIPVSLPTAAPLAPLAMPAAITPAAAAASPSGQAFHAAFTDAVAKVESFQNNAQASIDGFLAGDGQELHQVALATQQAELSFDLFLQVRNKIVAAYEEVMRMQV
jgi:flagellar hook-basal body complex protein FliE